MKKQILKPFLLGLSSLLIIFGTYKLIGCAGGDDDFSVYSFFDANLDTHKNDTPLFVSWNMYNGYFDYTIEQESNAKEWSSYLNGRISKEGIVDLFYGYYINSDCIDSIYQFIDNKGVKPVNQKVKELAEAFKTIPNNKAILQYIKYAKDIEKLCNIYAWDDTKPDPKELNQAIIYGTGLLKSSKDLFLKTRLAFQVERLYFAKKEYKKCEDFYKSSIEPIKPTGTMKFRTLGYYAGSLFHQKRIAESNYLFSLIYDQYPEAKQTAFESFQPWENADWEKSLSMTQTTHEKEVLWQLFGIYADPLKGMKEIYKLNPKSELLDLLLVRSINIVEIDTLPSATEKQHQFTTINVSNIDLFKTATTHSRSLITFRHDNKFSDLVSFVESCANDKSISNPCLWYNAAAYLQLIFKNQDKCKQFLAKVQAFPNVSKENILQANTTDLLMTVLSFKNIDTKKEEVIFDKMSKLPKEANAFDFSMNHLAKLYEKQNNLLKTELCRNEYGANGFYIDSNNVNVMLAFMRSAKLSNCEKFYADHYRFKEAGLVEYQAVNALYNLDFTKAIAKFAENKSSGNEELYGNPFNIHINDCHDCDHAAVQKVKYSKETFTHKMFEMLKKTQSSTDSDEVAQNYFLFANGLYNMTYYGNGRMIHETCLELGEITKSTYSTTQTSSSDLRFSDCKPALEYYQKAMKYGRSREFKTKCAWMCAKCELNIAYETNGLPLIKQDVYADFIVGDYFKLLRKSYSNTKYYKQIIQECGYFCTYNGGGINCMKNKEY